MPTTPIQAIIDPSADSSLTAYVQTTQAVPTGLTNANVYISTTQQYVTNYVSVNNDVAGGDTTQVQFNTNDQLTGDSGFTYNATTDTLTVAGNLNAGGLLTDNLYYSNGTPWNFSSGSYANSNVAAYLPTYTGNVSANRVSATLFLGSGANLTNINGSNVSGAVASATSATTAGTVTTASQPNITSVGTLTGLSVSGTTNLNAVGNITITGGTNGQVLTTNGSGVLSWSTVSGGSTPNLEQVTTAGATTDQAVSITNTTESTGYSTGALKISGGLGVAKAIHTQTHVTAKETVFGGQYSDFSSWTYPKFVGRDAGSAYIQGALVNITDTGSADWIAYGDSSTTDTGWADLGFTGTGFNDPLYSITKESDGYLFVQGLGSSQGGPQGGNLVLATGSDGLHSDIVFATDGFDANNERMRLDHGNSTLFVGAVVPSGTNTVNLDVNGNIKVGGNITFSDSSKLSSAPRNEPKFDLGYSTFSVAIGKRYLVDSLGGAASTTLPTSPSTGDAIYFTDAFGSFNTNNFTVNKSDKNIMGGSSYVASTNGQSFGLVYNGSEWRTYN